MMKDSTVRVLSIPCGNVKMPLTAMPTCDFGQTIPYVHCFALVMKHALFGFRLETFRHAQMVKLLGSEGVKGQFTHFLLI